MKIKTIILSLCVCACNVYGAAQLKAMPEEVANKIVDTIYKIEGGSKAMYPYGIVSVKTSDPRRVCRNTVINNYGRWQKAGSKGDYFVFLSEIYCPTKGKLSAAESKLNKNWLPNLKKSLGVTTYQELHNKMMTKNVIGNSKKITSFITTI